MISSPAAVLDTFCRTLLLRWATAPLVYRRLCRHLSLAIEVLALPKDLLSDRPSSSIALVTGAQRYFELLARQHPLDPLYVPRRFTAVPESGSISDDLQYRAHGILGEREPLLEELLTRRAIAIVADPGGGKSVVGRAAMHKLIADGERVPIFAEIKQYRTDLAALFAINTPAAILNPAETLDGLPLRKTYILDGIDEIPAELLERLGRELQDFIPREPESRFVCTARQAFYVANRRLLPAIPSVFHILPLADEAIQQYAVKAGIDAEHFMAAIQELGTSEEIRNPFILSVTIGRFRSAGSLSKLKSENLSYMIDQLIQSRPQLNAHRQRRALRMLGVAMETYSRSELTDAEALRVIREAMRSTEVEARELLDELYASILRRTGNGLAFQLASYGEYLAAEVLEDASVERIRELAFVDFLTPNETWQNTVNYLVELNQEVKKLFVHSYPFWTLSASPAAFSDYEKDIVVNHILKEVASNNQFVFDHPRIQVRRMASFITQLTESVLEKDLRSTNEQILGNALVLLGIRGCADIAPLAMEILSDRARSNGIRTCAIFALLNSGSPELVPKLIEILDHGDPQHVNIADLVGALSDENNLDVVLPVVMQTNAGLSATYSRFRQLRSRKALIAVLHYFLAHPDELNSIRAGGYVEPILQVIPQHWDDGIARLIVDLIDSIEIQQVYPSRTGAFEKLFEIVGSADPAGTTLRLYFARLMARDEAQARGKYWVDQILADLMRPQNARWLIEENATALIQRLAYYVQGEVREILRHYSQGVIDEQDAAARRHREESAEADRNRKSDIAALQDRLRGREKFAEAWIDFVELRPEHWPELPETFRDWMGTEISHRLGTLDLGKSIQWRDSTLREPQVLSLLLRLIDRYELRIDPDEPLVFAAMSVDSNVSANYCRRFGLSDAAMQAFERLLRNPPSRQALQGLVQSVEASGMWSDEIAGALRAVTADPADKGQAQVTALQLLAQHGVDDELIARLVNAGANVDLKECAFNLLLQRQHRPTIERALARLLADEQELRRGETPIPYDSPLDWIAKIRADFALPRLIELREMALRLELSRVTQLLSNTIRGIDRRELVRVIRWQLNIAPVAWRRHQLSQAVEQERIAGIEEAQRTPFDEVIKKLKGATSISRLVVLCEGATDVPVLEELVGQAGEIPEIIYGDVGGWSGLRNKDPDFLLLGSKAVIVVMDGDEGRHLSRHDRPLTRLGREQQTRLAEHGIALYILRRYGIENYFPQAAVERIVRRDLSAYFPLPHDVSATEHLSLDAKGLRYWFRRWVASKLDLSMPGPDNLCISRIAIATLLNS